MAKTATINMRISPEVKEDAESIFSSLGMTLTEAINIFLHKSIMEGGLPFSVRQPRYSRETEAAMAEAREILEGRRDAKRYASADELFDDLGI
ncbi:MAG: type II toxin-antitoxin system RelB/DinJ family antitoxin [Adlercreutzia sp.]|uniref:type II toxin-antitoxin system RelB/DinJ family antitoxin n=1 Tax=uncultured Adlercreutzia sp. TaxID=875803 RepID=UPI00217002E6|nr:type II toxin-antitoxin system RelB/DinJ family antitoxin [uncultured Adlercreutzia sp.]MCI8424883.1 type II toxin-antitoxin system RelB/DinJ family antitoxin [Adlercreutzia sp.]